MTADAELKKDLVQEMWLYWFRLLQSSPGKPLRWYLKSCEFHARNYLRRGRSIDSYKRSSGNISIDPVRNDDGDEFPAEPFDDRLAGLAARAAQGMVMDNDLVQAVAEHLSEIQRVILSMLVQGIGVREIARELKVTHPAVIKHRKRIASIARRFLDDSGPLSRRDWPATNVA